MEMELLQLQMNEYHGRQFLWALNYTRQAG